VAFPEAYMSWFAVTTRPNLEKGVTTALSAKGLQAYLPTYRVRRRWSDRMKELEMPVFSGYAFCRPDPVRRVLPTPGVTGIVSFGNVPAMIDDAELEAVRRAVESGLPLEPWPFVQEGQPVTIVYGPLTGVEGQVVKVKNQCRLVVSISMLQRSMSVEIDREWARPANPIAKQYC
jgi:transcription antitermination factor NusG